MLDRPPEPAGQNWVGLEQPCTRNDRTPVPEGHAKPATQEHTQHKHKPPQPQGPSRHVLPPLHTYQRDTRRTTSAQRAHCTSPHRTRDGCRSHTPRPAHIGLCRCESWHPRSRGWSTWRRKTHTCTHTKFSGVRTSSSSNDVRHGAGRQTRCGVRSMSGQRQPWFQRATHQPIAIPRASLEPAGQYTSALPHSATVSFIDPGPHT